MELSAAGCLSPQQNQLFASVLDWLQVRLEIEIEPADPASANIVYMCGLPTGQNLDRWRPLAAPVMAERRYRDEAVYFSDVISGPGFEVGSWEDLNGIRIAYNEEESFSGWAALQVELQRRAIDPGLFIWQKTGSHQNSLAAVASGAADLAAIDSMVLALEGWSGKIFATLGPWPAPPFSIGREVADSAPAIGDLLNVMHEDHDGRQRLARFGVSRLQAVEDQSYQQMAQLVKSLGSAK